MGGSRGCALLLLAAAAAAASQPSYRRQGSGASSPTSSSHSHRPSSKGYPAEDLRSLAQRYPRCENLARFLGRKRRRYGSGFAIMIGSHGVANIPTPQASVKKTSDISPGSWWLTYNNSFHKILIEPAPPVYSEMKKRLKGRSINASTVQALLVDSIPDAQPMADVYCWARTKYNVSGLGHTCSTSKSAVMESKASVESILRSPQLVEVAKHISGDELRRRENKDSLPPDAFSIDSFPVRQITFSQLLSSAKARMSSVRFVQADAESTASGAILALPFGQRLGFRPDAVLWDFRKLSESGRRRVRNRMAGKGYTLCVRNEACRMGSGPSAVNVRPCTVMAAIRQSGSAHRSSGEKSSASREERPRTPAAPTTPVSSAAADARAPQPAAQPSPGGRGSGAASR
eukprot:TRINITY_DN16559_c0_g3_i1.p1 TRINITY_DN16559_c0_g3~~TRINITY_DN16559_c0_g3_i1.p1  ORF type:complete len:432 (+),score=118.34 TRINITY_DN16559_c0_g3_i1:91-1296(+)